MNMNFDTQILLQVGLALFAFIVAIFVWVKKRTIQGRGPEVELQKQESPRDIKSILSKTRQAFSDKFDALVLSTKKIDSTFVESLEELLYTSDLGPKTVEKLLGVVRSKLSRGELGDLKSVKKALQEEISLILYSVEKVNDNQQLSPHIVLVVGVNGVGKTTSIGKLAHFYVSKGKKVLIVAGDTFRAAAGAQLSVWSERAQVDFYSSSTTVDAAAVAYEGIQKGLSQKVDVIIVDTAGRLHTKDNLMEELKKIKRVMGKAHLESPHEVLLVIDANSGQNAIVQAKQFNDAIGVTGLIVTKLDGTARGGVIVGIAVEVGIGVQFIGVGEKMTDLKIFSSSEYAQGLLSV
ncbi:MAG: signal recognition particle-docking protein FtsY [Oligoflexia bacterium]|nr:signal recognition particle-docking protein FtsY [Oligoflexia bacterium]